MGKKNIRFNSSKFLYDTPYGEQFFDKLNELLIEIIWKIQSFYTDETKSGSRINKKFQKKDEQDPEVCIRSRKDLLAKLGLTNIQSKLLESFEDDCETYKVTKIYQFTAQLKRSFSTAEDNLLMQIRKRVQQSIFKWCALYENVLEEIYEDEDLYEKTLSLSFDKVDTKSMIMRKKVTFCEGFIGDGKTKFVNEKQERDYEGSEFWRVPIKEFTDKNGIVHKNLPSKYFLVPIYYDLFKGFFLDPNKDELFFSRFLPCNSSFSWTSNIPDESEIGKRLNEIKKSDPQEKSVQITYKNIRLPQSEVADSFIIQFMYLMGVEEFNVNYFIGEPKTFSLIPTRKYEMGIYDHTIRMDPSGSLKFLIDKKYVINHHCRNFIKLSRFFGNALSIVNYIQKVKGIHIYCPDNKFKIHQDELVRYKFSFEPNYWFCDAVKTKPRDKSKLFDGFIEALAEPKEDDILGTIRYLIDPCYDGLYFYGPTKTVKFILHGYSYEIDENSPSVEPKCFYRDENKLTISHFISNNALNAGLDIYFTQPVTFKKGIAKEIMIPAHAHYLRSLENWYVRSRYIEHLEIFVSGNKLFGVSNIDIELDNFLQFVPLYKIKNITEQDIKRNLETFYRIYVDFEPEALQVNLQNSNLKYQIKKRKAVDVNEADSKRIKELDNAEEA